MRQCQLVSCTTAVVVTVIALGAAEDDVTLVLSRGDGLRAHAVNEQMDLRAICEPRWACAQEVKALVEAGRRIGTARPLLESIEVMCDSTDDDDALADWPSLARRVRVLRSQTCDIGASKSESLQLKRVHHVHVARTGGTELCACAVAGGYAAPVYHGIDSSNGNCWPRLDDQSADPWEVQAAHNDFGPRWIPLSGLTSLPRSSPPPFWVDMAADRPRRCQELAGRTSNWSWVSNEGGVFGDPLLDAPCPQFTTVIQLRDPIARLESHLRLLLRDLSRPDANVRFESKLAGLSRVASLALIATPVADNFAVRTLLGNIGMSLPFGAVTTRHRRLAQSVLERFDLVNVLGDDFDNTTDPFLAAALGIVSCPRRISTFDYENELEWDLTLAERRVFQFLNRHDVALLEFARRLRDLDRHAFARAVLPNGL